MDLELATVADIVQEFRHRKMNFALYADPPISQGESPDAARECGCCCPEFIEEEQTDEVHGISPDNDYWTAFLLLWGFDKVLQRIGTPEAAALRPDVGTLLTKLDKLPSK